MKKFLAVGPNVARKTDIHGFTYNYCSVGACDGQGEGEKVIREFDEGGNRIKIISQGMVLYFIMRTDVFLSVFVVGLS